jgi:hypothetical protein
LPAFARRAEAGDQVAFISIGFLLFVMLNSFQHNMRRGFIILKPVQDDDARNSLRSLRSLRLCVNEIVPGFRTRALRTI